LRDALGTSLHPAIFNRDGATLDPAQFTQSLHENSRPRTPERSVRAQDPDCWQPTRLLRACRDRRRSPPAQHAEAVASLHHSITSSARASRVGGMSRPSVLAVLRLIVSSYLVGCWTGSSATFAPLRIRST